MRKTILALCCITMTHFVFGQIPSQEYFDLIWKADSLYKANDYKASALTYADAFNVNGGKAYLYDQYNAAGSWALAGESDSAFSNLERFIAELNFSDYDHVINNPDLNSLHNDKRWQPLLAAIKANKDAEEASANKPPNVISNGSVSKESDVTYLYLN